jgi:hypothetical protein
MRYILFLLLFILFIPPALAETFEFEGQPNIWIPDWDSIGVRDTIFIPDHIQIEDINFFMGIGDDYSPWAEQALVDVFSPERIRVRLNGWGGQRINWYFFWYDTDHPVDGPGSLQDYNGTDAYGPWELFCFDPFPRDSLFWHYWRIQVIGNPIQDVQGQTGVQLKFGLDNVYPNPFNPNIKISFCLPLEAHITLDIYDLLGRKIETIKDETQKAGYYQVTWNADNVPSGVYFVRLKASEFSQIKKITLLK